MSWLYSQALVEEYLADTSLDGEQSAPLSGNPTPQAYCAPDKMTAFSRLSRFGMTFAPLTDIHGEELSMSSVVDFHVKTFQRQEKAQVLMESEVECGEKWRGSFVKFDQDMSLWKTHQCSLLGDLEEFSETWPQWGLMRNGECWEQKTLERRIRGTESGSELSKWATPTTMDKLPPKSAQALHKEATQARPNRSKPANLRDQVSNMHMWPTPVHSEARQGLQIRREGKKGTQTSLSTAVLTWLTPVCQDSRHATTRHLDPKNQHWKSNLGEVVMSLEKPNIGGRLNPTWVEWLMGWPLGWTDLKPLEMDKSLFVRQQHGESLQKDN
jgi:hypothetical protein